MAELAAPEIETPTHPEDFAEAALRIIKTDPDAVVPPKKEAETKTEPDPKDARRMPDELFGKEKKADAVAEPEKFEMEKIADPDFKDPKRKADWEAVKKKGLEFEKKAREEMKRAADLETKIKDYEAKGKDTEALQAKLATLEKEHAEAMELVRKVNIELDPEFRRAHVEGRANLVKQARTLVEESGLDPATIETAINLRGKPRVDAIKALEEDLGSFQSGRLGRLIDELDALDRDAESKRSNPEQYLETRKREDEQRTTKEREESGRRLNQSFEEARRKMSAELEVLRPVEGLAWWNDQAKGIQDKARDRVSSLTGAHDAAEMAIQAEAMPVYRDLFLSEREEHAADKKKLVDAEKELKKLYGTNPGVRGNGASSNNGGAPRDFADTAVGLMNGTIPVR